MNRFEAAVFIQGGACNPVAVAGTLHKYMLEMMHSGADHRMIRNDSAIRLIGHQLAFLLNIGEIDAEHSVYSALLEDCKSQAGHMRGGHIVQPQQPVCAKMGLFTMAELDAAQCDKGDRS